MKYYKPCSDVSDAVPRYLEGKLFIAIRFVGKLNG
jgi:hypothetical protein